MKQHAQPHDLPNRILDQAIGWAVLICSGTASEQQKRELDAWRCEDARHEIAWARMLMIDGELANARQSPLAIGKVLEEINGQRSRQKRIKFGGVLVLFISVCLGLLLTPLRYHWQADYVTGRSEIQQIALAGGALLHINTNTALAIDQKAEQPQIRLLYGEVLIDSTAAPTSAKPVVMAGTYKFRPVGTRFVVRLESTGTLLSVIEGRVDIRSNNGDNFSASAGESWQFAQYPAPTRIQPAFAPGTWAEGVLEADNARLGDVLDALSSRWAGWLTYDTAVADLRVTGVFYLADPDRALTAIAQSLPVKADRRGPWWTRIERLHKNE